MPGIVSFFLPTYEYFIEQGPIICQTLCGHWELRTVKGQFLPLKSLQSRGDRCTSHGIAAYDDHRLHSHAGKHRRGPRSPRKSWGPLYRGHSLWTETSDEQRTFQTKRMVWEITRNSSLQEKKKSMEQREWESDWRKKRDEPQRVWYFIWSSLNSPHRKQEAGLASWACDLRIPSGLQAQMNPKLVYCFAVGLLDICSDFVFEFVL